LPIKHLARLSACRAQTCPHPWWTVDPFLAVFGSRPRAAAGLTYPQSMLGDLAHSTLLRRSYRFPLRNRTPALSPWFI